MQLLKKKELSLLQVCALGLLSAFAIHSLCIAAGSYSWKKAKLELNKEVRFGNIHQMDTFIKKCFSEVELLSDENLKPFVAKIQEKGFEIRSDTDTNNRPLFVGSQAHFERVLAYLLHSKEIVHLVGMIHTPTPATPFCTKGSLIKGLVDSTIEKDAKRAYTVMTRPNILRDYLAKGGILFITYPEGGRSQRTNEQLEVFDEELARYPHHLIDHPLDHKSLDPTMSGATYLFKTKSNGWGAFSIMASQANAPKDDQKWGIWFGSLHHPQIYNRVNSVLQYIYDLNGPNILAYCDGD